MFEFLFFFFVGILFCLLTEGRKERVIDNNFVAARSRQKEERDEERLR